MTQIKKVQRKRKLEKLFYLDYNLIGHLPEQKLNMERKYMIYGTLEIEIMNVLWNLQEQDEDVNVSVGNIVKSLDENNIERAYTTVKTVMDRLVAKDILVRYRNGKKFFYRSTIDKNEAAKKLMDDVSTQFFDGSYLQMLRFIEKECEHLLI